MLKIMTFLAATVLAAPALAQTHLLMAEQNGCHYCEKWDREIAKIYPKTAEGQFAPLIRYDIHDRTPQKFTLDSGVHYTPTFILIDDGKEVGRVEGYAGEDFFWGLLEMMIKDAGLTVSG